MKKPFLSLPGICLGTAAALLPTFAAATEPCGDFGECKTLVEINASDGDIGFHFLSDGDDLKLTRLLNPNGKIIFSAQVKKELEDQTITELFAESAEPLCFDPLTDEDEDNDDEDFRTLEEFIELFTPGSYKFVGRNGDSEQVVGRTVLGFDLPAAPQHLAYDGGMITWTPGNDLGACADTERLQNLVHMGRLPAHPENVPVAAWDIVLEPDVEDGNPIGDEVFSIRIAGDAATLAVSVPYEYLMALPEDTPAKLEIGAIGEEDNATFTELGDICLNENEGCDEDDEEEEDDEQEDEGED